MPGLGQGRGAIGETVASFPTYEGAQKAVSSLVAADIPARDIAIVGNGLRSVERVTGKLGYATAARQGAINGLLLGLFFSAIFVLGNSAVGVSVFVGVLFVGVALGMLLSIGGYAIIRRRRDFASVTQVIAEHYEVTVLPTSIHRAREVLGPVTTVARPPSSSAQPPTYGQRSETPPQFGVRADEPPKYGQRVEPDMQRPAYGQRTDEPPRYGQRVDGAAGGEAGREAQSAEKASDDDAADKPEDDVEKPDDVETSDAGTESPDGSEPDGSEPDGTGDDHRA